MEGYTYPYPSGYPMMRLQDVAFPDRGDGFGDYYEAGPADPNREIRRSRSRTEKRKADIKRSRSRSASITVTRTRTRSISQTRTRSRSRSCSRSQTRSRTRSRSHSRSGTHQRELKFKEPGFLDAFRILYLTPSKHKSTTKYLATKKRQDHIQEILKSDGLGSKKWLFYPRPKNKNITSESTAPTATRENSDQRVRVDADFFRKYKRSKKVDSSAPIAKLKRWELILYKKLGFIQAVD